MKTAICDDQEVILKQMEYMIKEHEKVSGIVYKVSTYSKLEELWEEIQEGTVFDLLFLDIEVGNENSIATAEKIMRLSPLTGIVFMTAYDHYMLDAFEARPMGFISKPLCAGQVIRYVDKAYEMMDVHEYFEYVKRKKIYKIMLNDIYYIESFGRKIIIHSKYISDEFYGRMRDVEKLLGEKSRSFQRISQSYIVNTKYFICKTTTRMDIQAGEKRVQLPISRSYIKQINEWYIKVELSRV